MTLKIITGDLKDLQRRSITTDEICEATRLSRHTLESVVGGVLDTMIRGTLADGRTRRFGETDAMFFFCPWTRDTRPYSNAPMLGSSSHVKIIF